MRESKKVKILEFKTKANESAKQLLAEARKNEPAITKELKSVAKQQNAKLVSLENKFKDESSLVRKLSDNAVKFNSSVASEAKRNNDTLRYTMIFSPNDYRSSYNQVLSELSVKGYSVRKIWDAWALEESPNDTGYRGINVTIISSQSQKFELQFHTAQSFRVKKETHGLYEEKRNPDTSSQRRSEIDKIMKKLAAEIERPKGI